MKGICKFCGKEFEKYKRMQIFCCVQHRLNFYGARVYKRQRNAKYLIPIEKCAKCGNDYKLILQVHHINRKRDDNRAENLQVLCPNCHVELHMLGYKEDKYIDFKG